MRKLELQSIINQIAKANRTTPEEVRQEMQAAMEAGLNNPDPAVQAMWNRIPRKGKELTLEEFIAYAARKASSFQA